MSNFGKKLKTLGIAVGIIGGLLTFIFTIGMFITSSSPYMYGPQKAFYITYGIVILIIGSLATLVSSFRLYGQGVQLDSIKAMEIKYFNDNRHKNSNTYHSNYARNNINAREKSNENITITNEQFQFCQYCGTKMPATVKYCQTCGKHV